MSENKLIGVPLEALAFAANEAADEYEKAMKKAIEHAVTSGNALLAAKQQIPHGQWGAWVGVNFDRDQRTASRYMAVAIAAKHDARVLSAGSIREALRLIADDRATPDEPAVIVVEPVESEIVEEETQPEIEPQERPSIRKVSAEARKVSEADREPTPEVRPVVQPELVEDERLKQISLRLGDMLTGCGKTWLVTGRKVDDDGAWVELTEEAEA